MTRGSSAAASPPSAVVRLEAVRKSFGDNLVLDGIDLEVAAGEVLVVIGASGSGKSTLLRCVNLLEPLDSGRIFFEGEEITGKGADVSGVRQRIGMVFQQFNLFPHLTVLDNVTLAARRIRKMRRAGGRGPRPRAARAGRARGEGRAASAPALGRPAAARRDRARADDGAARHALRRGHLGARSRARRRGPARHARAGAAGHDDDGRDARDAVRPRGGRPADLHGRGPDRRARRARRRARQPAGGADAAVPPPLAPARAFARRVVHQRGGDGSNETLLPARQSGSRSSLCSPRRSGSPSRPRTTGLRARGGDEAAAAAGEHQVAQPLHHRREVRRAAVRLHRRAGQERRLRRRDRHAGSPATRSDARAASRSSARRRPRASRC